MKNQSYRMTMLFDFFGEVLTARQKEFFDLYYNEDLSLAEIAENYNITRQGVRDVIVRAEAILTELEDKTGIVRRFHHMQSHLSGIGDALVALDTYNDTALQNDTIYEICDTLSSHLEALRQNQES
ncbi:MAG: DNA-binding protein [Oscillospiraceae bacterium]|nr:DNA-binding protein [Oscillospiraceae bacterium]